MSTIILYIDMEYNIGNRVSGIVIDIHDVRGAIDWGRGLHFVRGKMSITLFCTAETKKNNKRLKVCTRSQRHVYL